MTKGRQSNTAAKVDTGRSRKCEAGQEWLHEGKERDSETAEREDRERRRITANLKWRDGARQGQEGRRGRGRNQETKSWKMKRGKKKGRREKKKDEIMGSERREGPTRGEGQYTAALLTSTGLPDPCRSSTTRSKPIEDLILTDPNQP